MYIAIMKKLWFSKFKISACTQKEGVPVGTQRKIDSRTPAIWIDAGIHARGGVYTQLRPNEVKQHFDIYSSSCLIICISEWIAPATAMNVIRTLITGYNTGDAGIHRLVDNLKWYITVVLNPDGYEYSHTKVKGV